VCILRTKVTPMTAITPFASLRACHTSDEARLWRCSSCKWYIKKGQCWDEALPTVWPRRKEYKSPGTSQILTLTKAQKCLLSRCQTAASPSSPLMALGTTSLKELQLSSAAWWIFWCTLCGGSENGRVPWFWTVKSLKILFVARIVVTVFLSR